LQAEKQAKLTELKSSLAENRPGAKSVAGIDTMDHIDTLDIDDSPMKLNEEIEVINPKNVRRNSRASSNSPQRHAFSKSVQPEKKGV
jgi:hypothetical protein